MRAKHSCCESANLANWSLRFIAISLAGMVSATSFGHSAPIRNHVPQQVTDPANTENPVFFPKATSRAIPGDSPVDQLLIKFLDLHTSMKYESAAKVAKQLVQLRPQHKDSHYNLACAFARLDRIKDALEELDLAIEFGWRDTIHLALDTDLDSIRQTRKYACLLKKISKLSDYEKVKPSGLRNDAWSGITEDLSNEIPALLKRYHVPGASVALVRNGQVVWNSGFGAADLSTASPVNENTVFPAPGSDQLFAAIATMQLHEKGALEFTISNQTNKTVMPVALRTEKTNQASWNIGNLTLFAAGNDQTLKDNSGWVNTMPASNAMTLSLQSSRIKPQGHFAAIAAVESISDQSFDEYCHDNLFTPIEANNTWLGFSETQDTQIAIGYSRLTTPVSQAHAIGNSSLNVHCTSIDLARLMTQIMFEPPGESTTLLDNVTIMKFAQIAREFGLEASVDQAANALRMQLHKVSNGTGVLMRWYPSQRCGIVVLYNSETGSEAAIRIAHKALGGE